jgi:hypothetical protein
VAAGARGQQAPQGQLRVVQAGGAVLTMATAREPRADLGHHRRRRQGRGSRRNVR